jgi:hypothetical protein
MPAIRQDQAILRLIKQVNDIWAALRQVTVNLPLFDIANENTPDQITSDQNNYVPGNYDILRLSSSKDVNITGLRGGVKGRALRIFNVGSYRITFTHQDANSDAANRFDIVGEEDISVFAGGNIYLYYDKTIERWVVPERPSWYGIFGLSVHAFAAVQSIPGNGADTKITKRTVTRDDWNMFDAVNSKITIPDDGIYLGVLSGNFDWHTAGGHRKLLWSALGSFITSQGYPAITTTAVLTPLSCPLFYPFSAGDEITMYANQYNSATAALGLNNAYVGLTRVL